MMQLCSRCIPFYFSAFLRSIPSLVVGRWLSIIQAMSAGQSRHWFRCLLMSTRQRTATFYQALSQPSPTVCG